MSAVRKIAIGCFALALTLTACGSARRAAVSPTPRVAVGATPTTAPPDCGNPVMSIAPTAPVNVGSQWVNQIRANRRLRAGVSADTLLFGFQNPFSGQLEGFDIDMVHRIAQEIFGDPSKVEFRVMSYAQRIPALQAGTVDIVADVMTINCARWEKIDFSSQYFEAGQKVLVASNSAANSINDLKGKRVCVAKGSTNLDELQSHYKSVIAVPVDDISDCMVLFQEQLPVGAGAQRGPVDAVTGDDTVLAGFAKQDPYARVVGDKFTKEPYGLGIANTHPDFVQYVNRVLETMRADGEWSALYKKWLGGANATPPPAVYGRQPQP